MKAVVIGAGHNGLVCATLLARAGYAVTVCERAPVAGGCTVTEEIEPGFHVNTGALELEGMVSSGIAADLELESHGLRWLRSDHLLASWVGRDVVYLSRSLAQTTAELTRTLGKAAACEWTDFAEISGGLMARLGGIQHVNSAYAPASGDQAMHPFKHLDDRDLCTVLSTSQAVIDEHLSHPLLRGAALAYSTHPQMPPWVPGSGALGCLLASSHGAQSCRPVGGTGRLIEALAAALRRHGGELRCSAGVRKILRDGQGITGVELESGDVLEAAVVVSSIDLKRVVRLLDHGGSVEMEQAAAGAHTGIFNIGEMKLDLALDDVPRLVNCRPDFAGALYYLQQRPGHYADALREIMAGRLPETLPLMAAVPSIADPALAPAGKAVLWLSAFVPATWADDSAWPDANARVVETMLDSFEFFAPGARAKIRTFQATGPAEWERRTGNPAGNPNHLDMTADQLFTLRPAPGFARHRAPIRGLYLSGAGTHPGGGVHGMPGLLAAQAVFEDYPE
jgi:beta-carotene ketolase (CrtO type)